MDINERYKNIVDIYEGLDGFFDSLPDAVPDFVKNKLKEKILADKELKEIVDSVKNKRAPRIILIGNSGHGKSSLINAMLGYYAAKVSSVRKGTVVNEKYDVLDNDGKVVFSILDSRGINELKQEGKVDAEQQLLTDIEEFVPDAAIFVRRAKDRTGIESELKCLLDVTSQYEKKNGIKLPIIVALTQCDELDPTSQKDPNKYGAVKRRNIDLALEEVGAQIKNSNLNVKDIVVTSALMEYNDGELTNEDLDKMSDEDRKNLVPTLDGRYNIEDLKMKLFDSITDMHAQMGLVANFRVNRALKSVAQKMVHPFAGIGAAIAAEPIPVADIFILCALEAMLVMLIAYLSGREISYKAAGEMVIALGGVGVVGFGCKVVAQQAVKFLNLFPGAGSSISAAIAAAGVEAIGKSAIAYYFKNDQ